MSERDNDYREIVDGEDVVDVTSSEDTPEVEKTSPSEDEKEKNKDEYEDICYICRRPESVAGKMIHIPNNICICNDCMQKTFDSMGSFGFGGGDNAKYQHD